MTLRTYGNPDEIHSPDNDNPRYRMQIKGLIYRKEKVEMVFYTHLASDELAWDSKRAHFWTGGGALDPETKQSISTDEIFRRLDARKNPAAPKPKFLENLE
jgi:hypothetical protein